MFCALILTHVPLCPTPKKIIEGGVSPSEWARFEVLARRIQFLMTNDWLWHKGVIDPSVLRLLVGQYDGRPLLPNLRALMWTFHSRDLEQHMLLESLCRTRTLTKLIISPTSLGTQEFYRAFEGVWQGLRDLVITAVETANAIPPAFYSSFNGLRSARVVLTQPTHLLELAMLPHLESLILGVGSLFHVDNEVDVENTSAITFAFHGFPALRTLEVWGYVDPSIISRILPTITSPMLLVVILRINLGAVDGFIHLIETLCALPAVQQLCTIHLCRPPDYMERSAPAPPTGERWELSFKKFAGPLLQLRNLQDVCLATTWRIWSITDDDVRDMQQAWPHIQSLDARHFFSSGFLQSCQASADLPALSTLVTFAQNCRNLEALKMHCREIGEDELAKLDARAAAIELEESAYGTGSGPPRLQRLIVCARSGIFHQPCPEMSEDNLGRLTRALHRLFPCLEEIRTHPL